MQGFSVIPVSVPSPKDAETTYGTLQACESSEYRGPYGVLLDQDYTQVYSIASSSTNRYPLAVVMERG
jgi:hypothetical protein